MIWYIIQYFLVLLFSYQIFHICVMLWIDIRTSISLTLARLFPWFPQNDIWFHASNTGETKAILPLYAKISGIITCFTASVVSQFPQHNIQVLPSDNIFSLGIFFWRVRPKKLIISESDLFPIMMLFCKILGVPIILVSHPVETKSNILFTYLHNLWYRLTCDMINVQTDTDLQKIKELGFYDDRKYNISGNLKLIGVQEEEDHDKVEDLVALLSIHLDEMYDILGLIRPYLEKHSFVLIPRFIDELSQIETILTRQGFAVAKWNPYQIQFCSGIVYIVPYYGKVNQILKLSQFCVLGGTFANYGGHNILEPIRFKNYIICGKSVYNIHYVLDLIAEDSIIINSMDRKYCRGYFTATIRRLILEKDRALEWMDGFCADYLKPSKTI